MPKKTLLRGAFLNLVAAYVDATGQSITFTC